MSNSGTTYLFIDGGCLRETSQGISKRFLGDRHAATLKYEWFARGASKVFYYDAVPAQDHGEEREAWLERIAPQTAEFEKIRAIDRIHVTLGDLRGRLARQKKVDVHIAVDMLLHTVRGNMAQCTLLAGDIDFHPLIEALVREGMVVTLWHPPQAAADLVNAADTRLALTAEGLSYGLVRPCGQPVYSAPAYGVRPRGGRVIETWSNDTHQLELSFRNTNWLLERFDPNASATSQYFEDAELRPLLRSAEDAWGLTIPATVEARLQGDDR